MHSQPPDPELQNQIWAVYSKSVYNPLKLISCLFTFTVFSNSNSRLTRYESCIDAEIQQRAVEYFALSRKGAELMDILAEMPKFPERQVFMVWIFFS